jgi:hypothetical protein
LRGLQKHEAGEQGQKNQREDIRFHMRGILPLLRSPPQPQDDMNGRL